MPNIVNIIFLETVMNQVKPQLSRRGLQRIKQILHDPRNCSIIFQNETFQETFTERIHHQVSEHGTIYMKPEPLDVWQNRSLRVAAQWYGSHLKSIENSPDIILLRTTESEIEIQNENENRLYRELTLERFLQEYISQSQVITLFESLKQVFELSQEQSSTQEVSSAVPRNTIGATSTDYAKHYSNEIIDAGIKSGTLFRGIIQVNKHYPVEAYVRLSEQVRGIEGDVLIPSILDRNRAVHGDVVAIELFARSAWNTKSTSGILSQVEQNFVDESLDNGEVSNRSTPTARVVGIVQRNWRLYAATFQIPERGDQRTLLAVPMDNRIPKVRINTRTGDQFFESRIAIRIDDWPRNSQYPSGHYVSILGPIGDIEAETKALMIENEIPLEVGFSENSVAHLPRSVEEWKVTEDQVQVRRDLRSRLVCSIDPPGCQDIDDALSVHWIGQGKGKNKNRTLIEIGVHIADVTHFVEHESLLDREARERGTTVYLADRRLDMLPAILSEQLCSIRERQDRYAMSVLWTVDGNTWEILKTWYGKTIIHSSHELDYQTAQLIVDDELSEEGKRKLVEDSGKPDQYKRVRDALLVLMEFSRDIKKERMHRGALELESGEVKFDINQSKTPTKLNVKEHLEVMSLVEEFMVLANKYVAKRIYDYFPSAAILRRHPPPRANDFTSLIETAAAKGFEIDFSSNKALADSLNKCVDENDPTVNFLMRMLSTYTMSEAAYFSTGSYEKDEFYHFGLAAEYYTHFTSPIRRYADILVHRQLQASVMVDKGQAQSLLLDNAKLSAICNHINMRNRNSAHAQVDSTKLFQALYFTNMLEQNQNLIEEGVIYAVRKNGFLVFVPKYSLKGAVFLREKDGTNLIPVNALLNSKLEFTGEFAFEPEQHRFTFQTTTGNFQVFQFDKVLVRIVVEPVRTSIPSIGLRLVNFGTDPEKRNAAPVKRKDLVKLANESGQSKSPSFREEHTKQILTSDVLMKYQQTNQEDSVYWLFEKFRSLSLN